MCLLHILIPDLDMTKFTTLASALFFALFTQLAHGQVIDYKTVIGQGSRQAISFGPAFEENHNRPLNLHFTLNVPTNEGQLRLQSNYSQPNRYGSLRFLTANGQVIEMVEMFDGGVSSGPQSDREAFLANLLQNDTVPNLGDFTDLNILGARRTQVGPYAAIEVVALYTTESYGQIALRAVGVFPPASENILVYISHTVVGVVDLPSVDALPGTFAGTMLESLKFTAARMPDGSLTPF